MKTLSTRQILTISCLSFLIATILLSPIRTAYADDLDSLLELSIDQLTNVQITSRKRTEILSNAPVSITSFNQVELDRNLVSDIRDLASLAPNLNFTIGQSGSNSALQAYIRGVGEVDHLLTSDPAVGYYIDGVYVARTFGANIELLDVERIEVLRGPQGTVSGKNTIGGAIYKISAQPSKSNFSQVRLSVGEFDTRQLKFTRQIWLPDQSVAVRYATLLKHSDGWQTRPEGNAGNDRIWLNRLSLKWFINQTTQFTTAIETTLQEERGAPNNMVSYAPNTLVSLFPPLTYEELFTVACCEEFVSVNPKNSNASGDLLKDEVNSLQITTTFDHTTANNIAIKSINAYRQVSADYGRDGDGSAIDYAGDSHDDQQYQWSSELQFNGQAAAGKIDWLAGVFYFRESSNDDTKLVAYEGIYNRLLATGTPIEFAQAQDLNLNFFMKQKTASTAIFSHNKFNISDKVNLDFGIRYTYEEKTLDQTVVRRASQTFPLGQKTNFLSDHWHATSALVGINFQFNKNQLTYGNISRGFRSGGFNGRPTTEASLIAYDPEYLTSYEIGLKSKYFKNKLNVNSSLFYNDYEDMSLLLFSLENNTAVVTIENAGESSIKGGEIEFKGKISHTELSGGLGYLDTNFDRVDSRIAHLKNNTFAHAPRWSFNSSISQHFHLQSHQHFIINLSNYYKDDYYLENSNNPALKANGKVIWNLSFALESANGAWHVALKGKNIFNKQILNGGFDATPQFGFTEAFFTPPRLITLEYSVNL